MDFDFQWWMLLPLIPLTMLGLFLLKVWRTRRRARRFLQLDRSERLRFARLVLNDSSVAFAPRLIAAGAAAYLAMPIDVIPDFIPIIGHADDFLVVTLLLTVMTRVLPSEEMEALVRRARQDTAAPAAMPVN